MAYTYAFTGNGNPSTVRRSDGLEFTQDPSRGVYQEWRAWEAAGNVTTAAPSLLIETLRARGQHVVNSRALDVRRARVARPGAPDLSNYLRFYEGTYYEHDGSPDDADYPLLAAEVPENGANVNAVHDNVQAEELSLRQDLGHYELVRRAANADIDAADTAEEIQAILDALNFDLGRVEAGAAGVTVTVPNPTVTVGSSGLFGFASGFFFGGLSAGSINGPGFEVISWTTIPSLDASDRNIYVSATGNDGNDGLSSSTPKLTIAAAALLVRAGHGDRLLFKKGDTWTGQPLATDWAKSGASAGRPIIFGAYGIGARPKISYNGDVFHSNSFFDDVWLYGLEITTPWDGVSGTQSGIWLYRWDGAHACNRILIEDCDVHGFSQNLVLQSVNNLTVRGCRVADARHADPAAYAQGLYLSQCSTTLIEFSTFARNGYNDSLSDSDYQYRHHLYDQDGNTNTTVKNCIGTDAGEFELRNGGVFNSNLLVNFSLGVQIGRGEVHPGAGFTMTCNDNALLNGRNYPGGSSHGTYFTLCNIVGGEFKRNLACNGTGTDVRGIWSQSVGTGHSIQNVDFADCIFHNLGCKVLALENSATEYTGNTWTNMVCQNPTNATVNDAGEMIDAPALTSAHFAMSTVVWVPNAAATTQAVLGSGMTMATAMGASHFNATGFSSTPVTYANPDVDLGDYNVTLGGTNSHAAAMARIEAQSKDTWDDNLTSPAIRAWLRTECFV